MNLPEYVEGKYTPAQLKNLEYLEGFAPNWFWGKEGDKLPQNPKGGAGSTNDPATADTLSAALVTMKRKKGGTVGLLISDSSRGLVGCDIDNVISAAGEIHPLGLEAIKRFAGVYVELSPSRTGLRIFCTGVIPAGTPKGSTAVGDGVKFEAYTHSGAGRWLRMTGALIPSTAGAVGPCQDGLDWLAGSMTAAARSISPSPDDCESAGKTSPGTLSLDAVFAALAELRQEKEAGDVIEAITVEVAAKPRGKLAEAWRGNKAPWKDDHSTADLFMCCEAVRRGAGHVEDVVSVWAESALSQREKFKRKDYRTGTIARAARAVLGGIQAKPGKVEARPWQEREGMAGVPEALQTAGEALLLRKGGGLAASRENVVLLLRRTPALQGLFWFDEFSQAVMRGAGAGVLDSGANRKPGRLEEDDLLRLGLYLSREHGMSLQIPELLQAVNGSARDVGNRRNPVRASLESLRAGWDGQPRLDGWIERHCLPASEQGREYLSLAGRMFFIQSVARVFQPGCKADTLLILCGDGGGRKSSLFRVLADTVGPELFRDTSFDLSDPKALVEQTAGSLFVELAELSSMRRARDVQAVKSALSGQVDRHRRPYAAMVEDCARAFTFVGSTNDETWITDASGGQGRRFWPIQTASSKDNPMNLAPLAAAAGQLWGGNCQSSCRIKGVNSSYFSESFNLSFLDRLRIEFYALNMSPSTGLS